MFLSNSVDMMKNLLWAMLCTKTPKSYNKVIGVVCKFQFIIHYIRGQIVELLLEQLWFFLCFVSLSYTSKWKWERFQKVSLHIQIRRNIALQLFFGPQSQQPELPVEPEEDFPLWKLENGTWKEPSCQQGLLFNLTEFFLKSFYSYESRYTNM